MPESKELTPLDDASPPEKEIAPAIIEQQKLGSAVTDYIMTLAEKNPFTKDVKIDRRQVIPDLIRFWPEIPGWEAEAYEIWGYISDAVRSFPAAEVSPAFLLHISVTASPLVPVVAPEAREITVIETFDAVAGLLRRCVVSGSEKLPRLDAMAIPAGIILLCRPAPPPLHAFHDHAPLNPGEHPLEPPRTEMRIERPTEIRRAVPEPRLPQPPRAAIRPEPPHAAPRVENHPETHAPERHETPEVRHEAPERHETPEARHEVPEIRHEGEARHEAPEPRHEISAAHAPEVPHAAAKAEAPHAEAKAEHHAPAAAHAPAATQHAAEAGHEISGAHPAAAAGRPAGAPHAPTAGHPPGAHAPEISHEAPERHASEIGHEASEAGHEVSEHHEPESRGESDESGREAPERHEAPEAGHQTSGATAEHGHDGGHAAPKAGYETPGTRHQVPGRRENVPATAKGGGLFRKASGQPGHQVAAPKTALGRFLNFRPHGHIYALLDKITKKIPLLKPKFEPKAKVAPAAAVENNPLNSYKAGVGHPAIAMPSLHNRLYSILIASIPASYGMRDDAPDISQVFSSDYSMDRDLVHDMATALLEDREIKNPGPTPAFTMRSPNMNHSFSSMFVEMPTAASQPEMD